MDVPNSAFEKAKYKKTAAISYTAHEMNVYNWKDRSTLKYKALHSLLLSPQEHWYCVNGINI